MIVMGSYGSVPESTALLEGPGSGSAVSRPTLDTDIPALALRVRGEYEEMPGLLLTVAQAARLFGVTRELAHAVLEELRRALVLRCSGGGMYALRR